MNSIPTQIGPYQINRDIGRGGVGVVYLAREPKLGRTGGRTGLPPARPEGAGRGGQGAWSWG